MLGRTGFDLLTAYHGNGFGKLLHIGVAEVGGYGLSAQINGVSGMGGLWCEQGQQGGRGCFHWGYSLNNTKEKPGYVRRGGLCRLSIVMPSQRFSTALCAE